MSQFKTTSSISPSILALFAQGEMVGVGVKGNWVRVLEEKKKREREREMQNRNLSNVLG